MAPHPLPMRRNVLSLLSLALLLVSVPAGALPMLDLDLDLAAPGVQSAETVAVGSNVSVTVTVSELEASASLGALDLRIAFDSSVLQEVFTSVGPGLRPGSEPAGPGELRITALVLGPGWTGQAILGGGAFRVLAPGSVDLTLTGELLDPDGEPIPYGGSAMARITAVPEPATVLLTGLAASALAVCLRRS